MAMPLIDEELRAMPLILGDEGQDTPQPQEEGEFM